MNVAKVAERGKISRIFFADWYAGFQVYGDFKDARVRSMKGRYRLRSKKVQGDRAQGYFSSLSSLKLNKLLPVANSSRCPAASRSTPLLNALRPLPGQLASSAVRQFSGYTGVDMAKFGRGEPFESSNLE